MRTQGNLLNVYTYNTGDFLSVDVGAGAVELPLLFAMDFKEDGGEAIVVTTQQVVNYTGFDAETQVLYLDNTTPLAVSAEAGTKIEVLPFAIEKRAVVDTGEGFEPFEARVPHNLQAVLEDGIRSEESGYEPVSIELDGSEWVLKEIYGKPAVVNTDALPNIPPELLADGIPPTGSPGVLVTPLGVGALTGSWVATEQPDLHDPIIYDVYVSATSPVVADADHFLTSTAGTSQSFSRVNVGGTWVPISVSEPSYMAVWARDSDGLAPTLGGEGSGIPRKADIAEINTGQLYAETIETLKAWAGTIDADFIFTNNYIMIGDITGSHIEINPAKGLILYGPNGVDHVVKLDMTAAQLSEFTGKINTNQLAVFDSLEISGILSRIMSAALLTIGSSTIAAPTSPPTLSQTTNSRVWPMVPGGFTETGLHWDGTNWNRTIYNLSTFETRVETINAAGAVTATVTLAPESADRDARGLTKSGGYTYTIRRDNAAAGSGKFYLKKYNSDGTAVLDTGGTETLTWTNNRGFYSQGGAGANERLRIDSSNVVHTLDYTQRNIRQSNTSGVFNGNLLVVAPIGSVLVDFDVDSSGNYYVLHTTKVVKMSSSGTVAFEFGSAGTGNGQFTNPTAIRRDGSGNIYVVDSGNNRVQMFDSSGVYQAQFGTTGTGNGQFTGPQGIAFDASGNIFIADSGNNRIQKFNSSRVYQSQFGTAGTGNGQFSGPLGIVIDTSNNIYVVDNGNYRIQKFNSSFVYQSEVWAEFDDEDEGPGWLALDSSNNLYATELDSNKVYKYNSSMVYQSQWVIYGNADDAGMHSPSGMVTDSSNNLWVADTGNHRIKKFNSSGVWQQNWGTLGSGNGQFNNPADIAIDSAGNIWVVDRVNNRIQKFNSSMVYQSQFGTAGTGNGQFSGATGIAIDSSDNIYIVDSFNNRIQKFDSSGTFITKWGTSGTGNGQFSEPQSIAIDPSGNVYVADTYNDRVQKFSNTGTYISKFGVFGSANGQFSSALSITIPASGNIYVSDLYNARVQKFNSAHTYQSSIGSEGSGNGEFAWASIGHVHVDSLGDLYVGELGTNTRIQKFTSTFPPLKKLVATELSSVNRVQPTLGWDSVTSNLVVGTLDTTNLDIANGTNAGFYRYSPSTLAYVSSATHSSANISSNNTATFVGIDSFDYGGTRAVIGGSSTVRAYTISGSAITADATYPTWIYEGTVKAGGWDGTYFWSAADLTALRKYSDFKGHPTTPANQRRFWAQYQWEDVNTFGTTPSPKTSFDLADRRWLNITVPTPGAGTGYTRIFTGNGTSTTNSTMYALAGVLATTGGTVQTAVVLSSGTNPKTVSDIPTGAAGRLEAQTGTFKVNGDSVGTWHEQEATPRFYGIMTATQSTAATVPEPVVWTESATHSKDSPGYYSYNATTGALTILKTGWWRLTAQVVWNTTTAGTSPTAAMYIEHTNGTRIAWDTAVGGVRVTNSAHTSYFLQANDIIQVTVEQDSGTVSLRGADVGRNFFSAVYDGPA